MFALFLSMSLSGGLLGLVVLLLKSLFKNHVSRTWQYFIWLVVFVRLLLPFTPPLNLYSMISETAAGQIVSNQSMVNIEQVSTILPKENAGNNEELVAGKPDQQNGSLLSSWSVYTKYLWVILPLGTIILTVRKIRAYKGFRRSIEAKCITVTDANILSEYSDMYRACKIGRPPPLYHTPLISIPMIVGFIRPAIFLPIIVTGDAKHILLHELIHCKRHDTLYKLMVQVVVCLHWFNPLVWLFAREMEKDCRICVRRAGCFSIKQ